MQLFVKYNSVCFHIQVIMKNNLEQRKGNDDNILWPSRFHMDAVLSHTIVTEEYYMSVLGTMLQYYQKKLPYKDPIKLLVHDENARPHVANVVTKVLDSNVFLQFLIFLTAPTLLHVISGFSWQSRKSWKAKR